MKYWHAVSYDPVWPERVLLNLLQNMDVDWLSGGFTPCRYPRPSSGREHTVISYSVRWGWFLMNETRRKPTTGTRCPTLLAKWYGIFLYARSHRHGWTYQDLWLGSHGSLPGPPARWNLSYMRDEDLPNIWTFYCNSADKPKVPISDLISTRDKSLYNT